MVVEDFSRYVVANPQDELWGAYSTGVGMALVPAGVSYPPRRHPVDHMFSWEEGRILQAFQVLHISQGSGEFESASFRRTRVVAGDLFILFPGEWHRYQPDSETGWTEDWLELNGEAVHRLARNQIISPERPFYRIGLSPEIGSLFAQCRRLADQQPPEFSSAMGLLGLQIISLSIRLQEGMSRSTDHGSRILDALALIESRINEPLIMEKVAEEVGMPYWQFRASFKSRTGLTPKQYHLQMRHRRAQDLLANTSLTLHEIADALGYDTAFHLSADFKKRTGEAPDSWRATFHVEKRRRFSN